METKFNIGDLVEGRDLNNKYYQGVVLEILIFPECTTYVIGWDDDNGVAQQVGLPEETLSKITESEIIIYGLSDDLIEIRGDIHAEFDAYLSQGYLVTDTGIQFSFKFYTGWEFGQVGPRNQNGDIEILEQSPNCEYSQEIRITGETARKINSISLVKDTARRKK